MEWVRRLAGLVGAILIAGIGGGGAAQAAPAMWRVSDKDSEVYLFGTLHALKPGVAWRTPLYDRVFRSAHTVWVETDLQSGDPDTLRLLIQRYGSDPDTPLSRKLRPADAAALARRADLARIDHLRPWAAALMLSMKPALVRGASVETGADAAITRAARDVAKRVRAFESLEDQALMFAGLPEPSELRYLTAVIRDGAPRARLRLPFQPASLEKAWLAGDMERLGASLAGDLRRGNPALYDALLKRRNLAWAERLAAGLTGEGVELVNVGALHMAGPDGLPTLLAARGFKVERVQ